MTDVCTCRTVVTDEHRVKQVVNPTCPLHATYTASEVKVLTETASKFGYELGRKEALTERPMWRRHRADVGEQIAEELEALNGPITPLAAAAFVRDLTSLPSQATSDATSGVPGHPEVSEAVRSPQEPREDPATDALDLVGALRKSVEAARGRRLAEREQS